MPIQNSKFSRGTAPDPLGGLQCPPDPKLDFVPMNQVGQTGYFSPATALFISNGEVHKVSASLPCFDKVLQAANIELCRDLTKMQLENESKEEKLTQLRHKMYSMHRNTVKMIAQKEKTIIYPSRK